MTNQEKIRKINEWHAAGFVHPMTCAECDHIPLKPALYIKDDSTEDVLMYCPNCNYKQYHIPDMILGADIPEWAKEMRAQFRDKVKLLEKVEPLSDDPILGISGHHKNGLYNSNNNMKILFWLCISSAFISQVYALIAWILWHDPLNATPALLLAILSLLWYVVYKMHIRER